MTMQEVADKIGISRQYYQMIECGERQKNMDITLVKSLSDVLGVPIEIIFDAESRHKTTKLTD
jgi:transcriptional regulator with XRE-family HTH domain